MDLQEDVQEQILFVKCILDQSYVKLRVQNLVQPIKNKIEML